MPDVALASAYILRPATTDDFGFLDDLYGTCVKPYIEATRGWAEAIVRAIFKVRLAPEREGRGR